ncbi:MAG: UbiX family flavin prenyltransferase [Fimbriimonadaceae bacterium]|jgi:4-hydroxy-3-polyprenylbenzoate decarboxylase|nr:UbiX family flavin prenyltransferase [Fimbriimonadaceae bacterium]
MSTGKLVVGITGASGAIYAQRFLRFAAHHYDHIYLVLSAQAIDVSQTELGVSPSKENFTTRAWLGEDFRNIHLLNDKDFFTPPASGSFRHDGMVIIPCSMGTAGRIAQGVSNDLLTRSADVCLKERRPLILVPREMPWNLIHLRNFTQLTEAGATILPACPAWYQKPKTLEDLADTVVARVLQQLGVEQTLMKQWMAEE